MQDGYFVDPSSGGKSLSRLCAIVAALAAVGLSFLLTLRNHPGEAVTVICAVLVATWGGYTANSTARVIVTKGQPPENGKPPKAASALPEE